MSRQEPLERSVKALLNGLDKLSEADLLDRKSRLDAISAELMGRYEAGNLGPGERVLLDNLNEDYSWQMKSALHRARSKGA